MNAVGDKGGESVDGRGSKREKDGEKSLVVRSDAVNSGNIDTKRIREGENVQGGGSVIHREGRRRNQRTC